MIPIMKKGEIMENCTLTLVLLERKAQHLSEKEENIGVQKTIASSKFILDRLKNTKDQN